MPTARSSSRSRSSRSRDAAGERRRACRRGDAAARPSRWPISTCWWTTCRIPATSARCCGRPRPPASRRCCCRSTARSRGRRRCCARARARISVSTSTRTSICRRGRRSIARRRGHRRDGRGRRDSLFAASLAGRVALAIGNEGAGLSAGPRRAGDAAGDDPDARGRRVAQCRGRRRRLPVRMRAAAGRRERRY